MSAGGIEREAFLARLDAVIAAARESEQATALLLVDLVNLRLINHRHSYGIGDALLREAAAQLRELSTLEEGVFRVGGHTFALLLPGVAQAALLPLAVKRVELALEEALELDRELTQVRLCVGVALNRGSRLPALALLARAEAHLASLRRGEAPALDEVLADAPPVSVADELEQPFADALYDNELALHYQPKVDIRSGEIFGAEALLRWPHERHGVVSPERLVRLATETGRLFELTKWVVHASVRQLRDWSRTGHDVPLAVNIPGDYVARPELANMLEGALAIWGVPPGMLAIEVTEQDLLQDMEAGATALIALRELGIKVSIDDFGTGYSSLAYLRDIPANELKIDRSFVTQLARSEEDRGLVKIIIEIAHLFGMDVVAEGVEDGETLADLRALGCDVVQGYHIAAPMPPSRFAAWLDEWRGLPAASARPAG